MKTLTPLLAIGMTACLIGGNGRKYPLARGPAGAVATARTVKRVMFVGELLTADDSSVVMLTGPHRVRRVLLRDIIRFSTSPRSVAWDDSRGRIYLRPALLRELQLVSRYPYGVSTSVLARIGDLTIDAQESP